MKNKRIIGALSAIFHMAKDALSTPRRSPEEQAAIEFQLDYDVTKPDAAALIDALGIAETERRLKRAKELGVSVFHPSVTGTDYEAG